MAHKYLGIVAAVVWLVQAVTGVALVFRWEIDAALSPGGGAATDVVALGERLEAIALAGGAPASLSAAVASGDRFDIYYTDSRGTKRIMRVDGQGRILRDRPEGTSIRDRPFLDTLYAVHRELLGGVAGARVAGISALLLVSNILFGLRLGWPRTSGWKRALLARPGGARAARLYGWHRLIGLWISVPVLLIVCSGTLLVYSDSVSRLIGGHSVVPADRPSSSQTRVLPARAMQDALELVPDARLSALSLPRSGKPWYRVRLRAPGEIPRMWGATLVFIDAADGHVLSEQLAESAPPARRFLAGLYPIHTAQAGGLPGRLLAMVAGSGLIAVIVLGWRRWRANPTRGVRAPS